MNEINTNRRHHGLPSNEAVQNDTDSHNQYRHLWLQAVSLVMIFVITILPFQFAAAAVSSLPSTMASENEAPENEATENDAPQIADGRDDDEVEVEGWLLSRPESGIGEWQVQKEESVVVIVTSDGDTRLDFGVPPVASWVKIKGKRTLDGSILATRIRVDEYEADDIVVRLADNGVLSSTVASRYGLAAVETLLQSGRIFLLRDANSSVEIENALAQMGSDADIIWAEYNYVGSAPGGNPFKVWGWGGTTPDGYENQFAFTQINLAPTLLHYQGDNIRIALLDTGVALEHPQLSGHLVSGWDMVADDAFPQDEGFGFGWGHGTHISGILTRIAPDALIMPVRVLDANGRGNTFTLAYAIDWAVAHDADVINLSLGTPNKSKVLEDAVANAVAKGVIVVAAAGNNNRETMQYPAGFAGVISVGAIDGSNHKTSFSNYGDWVNIAAPGLGITSTITGTQGFGYASWSGTSMATAFVSGVAALLKDKDATITSAAAERQLIDTGTNLDDSNQQKVGSLLNVAAALAVTEGTPTATATPRTSPTATPVQSTATPAATTATPSATKRSTPTPKITPSPTSTASVGTQRTFLPLITR